ncbi:riboflavin synthase [Priestia taiwanensis]|uniref:Riboflavin synthase n=1 Tax=Priestia taiwanensis TaxID=1347902 RepID=A0A917AP94_9BACI|nr:riboflavin synthase [Priestia taiwanensis]MBM7362520.1 riboflavin synthase [Priestia taiwanensis]GGE62875.1 riboflavin synthase subunit alpha [Priestia taiwanensis]
MFTGIIEEIGTVTHVESGKEWIKLTISAARVMEDIHLGDSMAINGICLTVTSFTESSFTVDIMPETVRATSLYGIAKNMLVNIERAMHANGRFGGHFVSGHVDGVGEIIRKEKQANAIYYVIRMLPSLTEQCIHKGSITIDGTSLTIFHIQEGEITISLIPHTVSHTILGAKGVGKKVNIEIDMIGKYIRSALCREEKKSTITSSFLEEHGFC